MYGSNSTRNDYKINTLNSSENGVLCHVCFKDAVKKIQAPYLNQFLEMTTVFGKIVIS